MQTTEDAKIHNESATETKEPNAEKPCLPCLLPQIMGAWTATRAACEFLPNDADKTKCRTQMEAMASDIKNIKSAEEVIYNAINAADDPESFINAEVNFAKAHNTANANAILKWADEQEIAGITIPEKIQKIVKALRIARGSDI